ncbi:MAG: outer membrane protein heavy metal efflux system [Mucilaginibacter sp.]|nr:outer membrane protein heavy metal efflux system [Mucilaginibacter sp.]
MKKKFNLVLFSGLLAFNLLKAQSPVLPLDTVLARISRTNPSLLAYTARANAQNEYAKGAKSLDAPKISAGQYQTPYSLNPNMGSFMIQADQMFINPAKLKAKEMYMQGMSAVTEQQQAYLKNQLLAQARQNYYDQVIIQKKLILLENTRKLLDYMLKDANIKLTYGKEKLSNIYKAKADLYQLDNTQEQLDNQLREERVMLNTLMNQNKQTVFAVDTNVVIKEYEANLTDTAGLAASRSDIKAIDRNIRLQQLSAGVEYSKRKPDFGIQAGHMFSYGGYPNQYILMASVTIPIVPWASKEYRANLKGIKYEVAELQNEKLDKLNEAEGQLATFRLDISSKKKQLKNYEQNIIPALQNSYKTALLAYEQNTGDLSSVLDGIKNLQLTRMEALDRLQELLQLQVAYEKENERY